MNSIILNEVEKGHPGFNDQLKNFMCNAKAEFKMTQTSVSEFSIVDKTQRLIMHGILHFRRKMLQMTVGIESNTQDARKIYFNEISNLDGDLKKRIIPFLQVSSLFTGDYTSSDEKVVVSMFILMFKTHAILTEIMQNSEILDFRLTRYVFSDFEDFSELGKSFSVFMGMHNLAKWVQQSPNQSSNVLPDAILKQLEEYYSSAQVGSNATCMRCHKQIHCTNLKHC